jgi:hypothetical protein
MARCPLQEAASADDYLLTIADEGFRQRMPARSAFESWNFSGKPTGHVER